MVPAISFLMGCSGEVSSSTLVGRCGTPGPTCRGLSCLTTLRGSQSPSFLDRPAVVCGNRLQILEQFLHFSGGVSSQVCQMEFVGKVHRESAQ